MAAASGFYLSLVKSSYLLERVSEAQQLPHVAKADLDTLESELKELKKAVQSFVKSGSSFSPSIVKKTVASFRPRLYEFLPAETKEQKILKKIEFFNRNANELNLECINSRLQHYAATIRNLGSQRDCNRDLLKNAVRLIIETDKTLKLRKEQVSLDDQVKLFWGSDAVSSLAKTNVPIFANCCLPDESTRIASALHFLIGSMQEEGPSCLHKIIEKGQTTGEVLKKNPQSDPLSIKDVSCLKRLLPQPLFLNGNQSGAFREALMQLESNGKANNLLIIPGIFILGTEALGIVLNYGRFKNLVGIFDPSGYTELKPKTEKLAAYFIAHQDIDSAADFLEKRFASSPPHLGGQLDLLKFNEGSKASVYFQSTVIPGTAPRPADSRSLQSYLRIAHDAAESVRSRQGKTLNDFLKAARLTPHYASKTSGDHTLIEIYFRLDTLRDAIMVKDKRAIAKVFKYLSECPLPPTIRTGDISGFLYERLYFRYKTAWEANPALPNPDQQAFNNQFGQLAFHGDKNVAIDPQIKLAAIEEVKETLKSNWRI